MIFNRSQHRSKFRIEEPKPMDSEAAPLQAATVLARIPPPHSAPSLRRTKPCRFYLDSTGCKSGKWCNFKHPIGARPEDKAAMSLEELRKAVVKSRTKGVEDEDEEMKKWNDVPDVRDVDPTFGKDEDGEVHPKWRSESYVFFYQFVLTLFQPNRAVTSSSGSANTVTNANSSTPQASSHPPSRLPSLSPFQSKLPYPCQSAYADRIRW